MYRTAAKARRQWPALLALVLLLAACRPVTPVIKIGFVAPFEGRQRDIGYDTLYSARLAVRQINAAGGVAGARLALVALDDGGTPEQAAAAARSLVIDHDVMIVVGHWEPAATAAAAPVYAAAGLALIPAGGAAFAAVDAAALPADFRGAYADLTPFDETAGSYAGPAYDAMQLALAALTEAGANGPVNRAAVAAALPAVTAAGLLGPVSLPAGGGS